jgi:hypothetical protein
LRQVPLELCLEAGMMANLRRQEDSPIQIAYVIPIQLTPAADAQAHASIGGNWRFPHMFQKMWSSTSVSAKSLVYDMADQSNQRNVLGAPASFLRQQKRLLANKVAMRRNEWLNPQTLNGQVLGRVWENQFQSFENKGILRESSTHDFLDDGSVAFRGRLVRNHIFPDKRISLF